MAVDPKWICNIRGKEFVMVGGLLDAGHNSGLIGIETDVLESLCKPAEDYWVVRAIGRFRSAENGEAIWSAVGDASPATSQMKGAYLRHAETRAVARMLRFATNCAMTAAEELGGEDEVQPGRAANTTRAPVAAAKPTPAPVTRTPESEAARAAAGWEGPSNKCSAPDCGQTLAHNTEIMSLHKFQRPLCLEHMKAPEQKKAA